jgi:hypothetical protein
MNAKTQYRKFLPACAIVLALAVIPSALAQCGLSTKLVKPSSWQPEMGSSVLKMVALPDGYQGGPSIVGMWHVTFTAQTLNGGAIPNTPIDNSVAVWHSDGTEIMNSSRPAQDGNYCMGVWEQTGRLKYYLNHIPWQGNDLTNAPTGIGNPAAGAQLTESVTLSPNGSSYSGTFTLTAYDISGNPTVVFTGILAATRITINTKFSDLL